MTYTLTGCPCADGKIRKILMYELEPRCYTLATHAEIDRVMADEAHTLDGVTNVNPVIPNLTSEVNVLDIDCSFSTSHAGRALPTMTVRARDAPEI